MGREPLRAVLVACSVAVAVRLLSWLTPEPPALAATLRHPQDAALHGGVDALALAAAATACWIALLWLVLALVVSAAAGLPGRCGRVAARLAAATVPATMRRLLAIALGATVATATGAVPAMASGLPQPRPAASPLSLDWPVAAAPAPSTILPAARKAAVAPRDADRSIEDADVIVRRGDSLWSIARRHLPPGATDSQIAAAWPRWHAANRFVVGADPDLLLPGQRLVPPDNSSGGNP